MYQDNSLTPVSTPKSPAAIGPYSQGVVAGGLLFVSGQVALDPSTGDFVAGEIEERTHQCLKNIEAIAQAAGSGLDRVVKVTVFLTNLENFTRVNQAYAQHFNSPLPARSTVQVAALPKGADIEIEAIIKL
jgi:2-iminobutanoate/2-iminopropanoate deaminase